jgi:two-component system LytT family response regulator
MPMVRSIIVEDDPILSKELKKLIGEVDKRISVLATCDCVEDALQSIAKHKPELVFLDIELGGNEKAGFDILKGVAEVTFDAIFTTGHIENNISEVRIFGLDYIIKPYVIGELERAINNFHEKKGNKTNITQFMSFAKNLITENIGEQTIWLYDTDRNGIPVKIKNIRYCKSKNEYTTFYFFDEYDNSEKTWITSYGLGRWEEILERFKFCRIHNEHLVNFSQIKRHIGSTNEVELITGKKLDVSKSGKPKLMALMNKV